MIKRRDFEQMTPIEQKHFLELVGNYQVKVTKRKSEQARISDLPLFSIPKPKELFDWNKKSEGDETLTYSLQLITITIMNTTKLIKENRKVKVSRRFIKTTWNEYRVPKISISGKYLKEAGFSIGSDVQVSISKNTITITVLWNMN